MMEIKVAGDKSHNLKNRINITLKKQNKQRVKSNMLRSSDNPVFNSNNKLFMNAILQWFGRDKLSDCEPHDVLYNEGDKADNVYLLETGSINLYKKNNNKQYRLIHKIYPGEIFGISSLLCQPNYHVTAKSEEKATFIQFSNHDLFNFLSKHPDQQLYLAQKLASRIEMIENGLAD